MPSPSEFAAAALRLARSRQLVQLVLGLAVGVIAAGAAVAFREGIGLVQWGALGFAAETVVSHAWTAEWWRLLLAPAAGGLIVGLMVRFLLPEGRPQGVADVMEAVSLRGGAISLRDGLAAAAASVTALGTGASVGREGPVVHLGAALSSWVARGLGASRALAVTLLGCGVASAIAASFNAPIAGVFFALEVVVGSYALSSFAPIVIASVAGTIVARLYYGDFPAFVIPDRAIASFLEFPAFALLGIVSAVIAILFIRATFAVEDRWNRTRVPRWARPMVAGLALGAVATQFPHVLGVGYETTTLALNESLDLRLLLVLLALKFAATALCLGSGFAGGVFSPAIVMGALAGAAFGVFATAAAPHLSSGPGAYAIVGMGAVAGAVLGAPISTILIVFELTSNFTLTIAVMIGVVIASVITQAAAGRSFFLGQLARRGVDTSLGREAALLRAGRVADLMRADHGAVRADAPLAEVRERLFADLHGELYVTAADGSGRLCGTIALRDLGLSAFDTGNDASLRAGDVARLGAPTLPLDTDLETAREVLEAAGTERLAVVTDAESQRLVGTVRARDVMRAHAAAIQQARAEERGEG